MRPHRTAFRLTTRDDTGGWTGDKVKTRELLALAETMSRISARYRSASLREMGRSRPRDA